MLRLMLRLHAVPALLAKKTVRVGYGLLQALNDGDCKRAKYEHDTETERRKGEAQVCP
jgi:hypothetical protein